MWFVSFFYSRASSFFPSFSDLTSWISHPLPKLEPSREEATENCYSLTFLALDDETKGVNLFFVKEKINFLLYTQSFSVGFCHFIDYLKEEKTKSQVTLSSFEGLLAALAIEIKELEMQDGIANFSLLWSIESDTNWQRYYSSITSSQN